MDRKKNIKANGLIGEEMEVMRWTWAASVQLQNHYVVAGATVCLKGRKK